MCIASLCRTSLLATAAATLPLAAAASAEDNAPAAAQQAAMQAWQRAAAVGPQHRQSQWFKGRWKARVQMWFGS